MECTALTLHADAKTRSKARPRKRKRSPSVILHPAPPPKRDRRSKRLRSKANPCLLGAGASASSSSSGSKLSIANPRGHYDVLGIPRTATKADVRAAYRRLALLTHPDKGGRPEDFLKVVSSWETLADEVARAEYDQDCDIEGCGDGQGVEIATEAEATPIDKDKITLGLARAALLSLLSSQPDSWKAALERLDNDVITSLKDCLLNRHGIAKRRSKQIVKTDGADFPRDVAPPRSLPEGWKCIEKIYHSGAQQGLTYLRYESPWHSTEVCSMRQVIVADAKRKGIDPEVALEQHGHDRGRAPEGPHREDIG